MLIFRYIGKFDMLQNDTTVNSLLDSLGLRKLLDTPDLTEIAINRPNEIWIRVLGNWILKKSELITYTELQKLANAMCVFSQLRGTFGIDFCIASVTLPTGERGQIVGAPATLNGHIVITLRKPSQSRFTLEDYKNSGRFDNVQRKSIVPTDILPYQKNILEFLRVGRIDDVFKMSVENRLNIAFSGGTGSGKTTLMKAVADLYPIDTRIVTIETSHELQLPHHPNKLHLFYDDDYKEKQKNIENSSMIISPHVQIKSCMRLTPDNIFLTELRGGETWNYFESLNTGHSGSITSLHANDSYSAFDRLGMMLRESGNSLSCSDADLKKKAIVTIDMVVAMRDTRVTEIYYNPEKQMELLYE